MDAAYALMVRTYSGIPGKTLLEAIELTNETFDLQGPEVVVASKNDQAMSLLTARLAGVQGAPIK